MYVNNSVCVLVFVHDTYWFDFKSTARWRLYTLINWSNIGPGNGLPPIRRQAITSTNAELLYANPMEKNFVKYKSKYDDFYWGKCFEKDFTGGILTISRPQYVSSTVVTAHMMISPFSFGLNY